MAISRLSIIKFLELVSIKIDDNLQLYTRKMYICWIIHRIFNYVYLHIVTVQYTFSPVDKRSVNMHEYFWRINYAFGILIYLFKNSI